MFPPGSYKETFWATGVGFRARGMGFNVLQRPYRHLQAAKEGLGFRV